MYQLVVTDDAGADSVPDSMMVTINVNTPPIADAGVDQPNIIKGTTVTLNGSGMDVEDGTNVTYQWVAPTGITLTDSSIAGPTFVAPDDPVNLTFSLIVTDSLGLSSVADTVVITVIPENTFPVAIIQAEDLALVNELIHVDGSASTGLIADYDWVISTGETRQGSTVSFNAPSTPGQITVTLTVTEAPADGGDSDTTSVTIDVLAANEPPTADTLTLSTNENTAITVPLAGTDPDVGDTVTVVNSSISTPANGSVTQVSGVYTYTPNSDFVGIDTFTYQVTDGTLTSIAATVTINVKAVNKAPTADAGDPDTIPSFRPIGSGGGTFTNIFNLDGIRSNDVEDTNGDNDSSEVLTYEWTLMGGTGTGVLANPNIENAQKPSIVITSNGEVSGTYIFQLSVVDTDGLRSESVSIVTITVDPPNRAPTASNVNRVNDTDTVVEIDLRQFASDPDGDQLNFEIINEALIDVPFDLDLSLLPIIKAKEPHDRPVSGSFQYRVRDIPHGLVSNIATVTISYNSISNQAPTAHAGNTQIGVDSFRTVVGAGVLESTQINLDGSQSSDPEEAPSNDVGAVLNYKWTQISGPAIVVSIENIQKPIININTPLTSPTDPNRIHVHGVYIFQLIVIDNDSSPLSSASSTVSIAVDPP